MQHDKIFLKKHILKMKKARRYLTVGNDIALLFADIIK